jgi:predicted membrane channel-forming protein YqfA (hemolysin III family)
MSSDTPTVTILRRLLLAILVLGLAGTEIELLLLKHTDGFWQLVPVVMVGLGLLAVGWFGAARNEMALRTLRALMFVYLATGGVGVVQHFIGNVAYARDSNPSLAGRDLYVEAVMGSTPTLAPGTMIQLALVGLAFVFRHPGLGAARNDDEPSPQDNR